MTLGILNRRIDQTPIAIIDFETTGLSVGSDRVVEVAVVRVDPGSEPRLAIDTLINPTRRVSATEIHGITDTDVADAPKFKDVAGEIIGVLEGCAIAAYNVYFDIKFLNSELFNAGVDHEPPHFCLMYIRPMLGLGPRCKLEDACRAQDVHYEGTHVASHDAMASGRLFKNYLRVIADRGIGTFSDLGRLKSYKFVSSFEQPTLPGPAQFNLGPFDRMKSRSGHAFASIVDPVRKALASYWDALKTVVVDLDITDDEVNYMIDQRQRVDLSDDHVRLLHARAFANAIAQFSDDRRIDEREARKLRRLHLCLAKLGWAPGE